jgi:hypothetical protein
MEQNYLILIDYKKCQTKDIFIFRDADIKTQQ